MSPRKQIVESLALFADAFQLFSDEKSQNRFLGILGFRLGLDENYADLRDAEAQYVNALTLPHLRNRPIGFIDGGAFDGDSFREVARAITVKEALLFEPDVANYTRLVSHSKDVTENVSCIPLALSDGYKMLSFSGGRGESAGPTRRSRGNHGGRFR